MRYETELTVGATPLTVDERRDLYESGIRCNVDHRAAAAFILSRECTLSSAPPTRVSLVTLPVCWSCVVRFVPGTPRPILVPGVDGL